VYVLLLAVLSYAARLDWPSPLAVETKGVIGTACFNIYIHTNIDKKRMKRLVIQTSGSGRRRVMYIRPPADR